MTIGNNYPLWAIGANNQILALDPSTNTFVTKSDNDFAFDLSVSEDGIVWVISTIPDPNGGAKIFWSPGDGTWKEMQKPTKEATSISGTTHNNCIYISESGDIIQLNTDGTSRTIIYGSVITEIDYGGGYYWAIFPTQPGGIPCLQLAPVSAGNLMWTPFAGNPIPNSLSVSYYGDCYAVNDFTSMFYSKDGKTTAVSGAGANGMALQVTFKNTYYLLSTNANSNGNEIMIWVDQQGGIWQDTGLRAIKISSSYYNPS